MGTLSEILPLINFLFSKNAVMMYGCIVSIDGGEENFNNIS